MKRALSLLLAVIIMGFLFSGCGKIPRDTLYTLRVPEDRTGERQWMVQFGESGVVSYTVREAENGAADVVFTGVRKGSVQATVYLARAGEAADKAVDTYVLTLCVDARKNVTQSSPPYGAYAVRLPGDVAGAEWYVECSDEQIVRWTEDREYPKKSAVTDGMQDFTQIYTFTGRHPGAAYVRICTHLPWAPDADNVNEEFWVFVDGQYRVSPLAPTDFVSFRVCEQGTQAMQDVYEAEKTENGVRLTHYSATSRWSDETNDYVETRTGETAVDGGEALYMYLAGLLHACGVSEWDGFRGSDPRVMDGTSFSFEAKLADGSAVHASGSNAFPQHYREFWRSLCDAAAAPDESEE